jgi:nucleoside-diphosphate-sugar epimerase
LTDRASGLQGQTILITGAASFLGVHAARELIAHGARLVLLDDTVNFQDLLAGVLASGRASFVVGGLDAVASPLLRTHLAELDAVVHIAAPQVDDLAVARRPADQRAAFSRLLNALPQRLSSMCVVSSLLVYDAASVEPVGEQQQLSAEPAATSLLALEHQAAAFGRSRDVPVSILRCSALYGPGEVNAARAIPSFIRSLLVCQPPVIYGDGSDVDDYLYVLDAARGIRLALEHSQNTSGIFNLGSGHGWSLRAVADRVQKILGTSYVPRHMPARAPRRGLVADIQRAVWHLGFVPHVHLEEGLKSEIDYHRSCMLAGAEEFWFNSSRLFSPPGVLSGK